MSKGILCFAFNNESVNYVKQAEFLAKRAKEFLNLPVSIVTDSNIDNPLVFDNVIKVSQNESKNWRHYHNGYEKHEVLLFKNSSRPQAYDLTPYDETILLDTDYIISSKFLLSSFDQDNDFLIHDKSVDISSDRSTSEFWRVSDTSVKFYWATCIFFRKTEENKIYFDLVKHIQENWSYYNLLYDVQHPMFRNDYAFSIAIHILNGFTDGTWAKTFKNPIYYSIDRDYLHAINESKVTLLASTGKNIDDYVVTVLKDTDVHVMNKFSLEDYLNV